MKNWTSIWVSVVRDKNDNIKHKSDYNLNLRTNAGNDWQAKIMCGDSTTMVSGSASATTATSLTGSGTPFVANSLTDHIIACGPNSSGVGSTTYGVILSNTTSAVLVDRWYNPGNPAGSVAPTPNATCKFQTIKGAAPVVYLALSTTVQSGNATDTTLAGEIGRGDGLSRAHFTTLSHSAGATSVSISKTFTATTTKTVNSEGMFTAITGGTIAFESAETSPPTLVSGDTLAQTCLINF